MQSKWTYQTYNMIFFLCASRGLRFTSLLILCGAIVMKWSFSEKDNGFVGYSVHRDFRGERADFQTRKLTRLVDNFMCNIHFNHGKIVNTLSRTKIISQMSLCNQYTINKRRPVVQRPSRLKSKNSRTRPDDHLNVALMSVISTIRRFYWKALELLKISRGVKIFDK